MTLCFLRVHSLVHVKNAAKKKNFQIVSSRSFIEPVKITVGIDATTSKFDTIQYVPILKTITRVLKDEDVLSHCLNSELSRNDSRIGTYYDNENCKQNKLFNSSENSIEVILYHDDLNVVKNLR